MTIRSKTVCDACGAEIDHLAQQWFSISTITRGGIGSVNTPISMSLHAHDADCFERLLGKIHADAKAGGEELRRRKAATAAKET